MFIYGLYGIFVWVHSHTLLLLGDIFAQMVGIIWALQQLSREGEGSRDNEIVTKVILESIYLW